jgi:hypothetical protein
METRSHGIHTEAGKDPMLPSYRPINLLDTVGKLLEKILLTRVLREANECRLLHDEQFGFQPRHSTMLQLAHFTERVNRNFDKRRLTSMVFLDVAKAFDTVWVKGLLYKLTILNFLSSPVKTISSYLDCRTFQTSFQSATSTCRGMRAWVAQGGLVSPVFFSLCVNDIPTPSLHHLLAQYAEDMALVAMSCSPSLLVSYLEAISVDWSISYGIGGLPSTSRRAPLCCLLRPRDASKNPKQCSFSESQYSGSKQHVILGGPWCTAYLVSTCQSGGEESSSRIRRAWPPP